MLFRDTQLRRILLILLIVIAAYFLATFTWHALQFFSDTLLLFFAAWVISFILSPVAKWLQLRLHFPRLLAVTGVYVALAFVLIGGIALAVPVIASQVGQIAARITVVASPANLQYVNNDIATRLESTGMSAQSAHNLIDQFTLQVQNNAQNAATNALANTGNLISSGASILLDAVIALILSFYMMIDGRRIMERLTALLPVAWRGNVSAAEIHVARVFGGFIRGQLFIGISYGILTWVGLAALGMANGFLISLIAGMIMLVPFIGPYLALIPPVGLAILETNTADTVRVIVILIVILFLAQQIVLQILAPRILSQSIGLHPLWLFAALLIGAKEAGVWGAFFAAPLAALAAVLFHELHGRWSEANPLFASANLSPPSDPIDERLAHSNGKPSLVEHQAEANDSNRA